MDFLKIENIVLLLYFFVPGFISMKLYRLLFAEENIDFSKSVYEALGYSLINFCVFFVFIYQMHSEQYIKFHPIGYFFITIFMILIAPICWTFLYYKLSLSKAYSKYFVNPVKTPWDRLFAERKSYWIIVTLKDGRRIGGKFSKESFASAYPRKKEIYIECEWNLDKKGTFISPLERSSGVLITGEEIVAIELFT